MADLQAYEITLKNQNGALPVRAVRGESLRGLFYSQLKSEQSNALHEFGQEKQEGITAPYSVSILSDRGEVTGLRIATFERNLGDQVATAWALLAARHQPVRLGNATLDVMGIQPERNNGETFASLYEKTRPLHGVALKFMSPTFIERRDHFDLLPAPKALWSFYMRRWEQYSPIDLPPNLDVWVEKCIYVRRISLETRASHTQGDKELHGMVGILEFHALMEPGSLPASRVDDYLRSWQALAIFAEFCGTGKYATEGFGRTNVIRTFGAGG